MGKYHANDVNAAFERFCPELCTKYSSFPMDQPFWLRTTAYIDSKPAFIAEKHDRGFRESYVFCRNAPNGPGYYHVLCQCVYTNLYNRLQNEGPPGSCCKPDLKGADDHDTVRRILYARSRSQTPNDKVASDEQISRGEGPILVHGVKI